MSIASEITRIKTASESIRDTAVDIGVATSSDKIDVVADSLSGLSFRKVFYRSTAPSALEGEEGDICFVFNV